MPCVHLFRIEVVAVNMVGRGDPISTTVITQSIGECGVPSRCCSVVLKTHCMVALSPYSNRATSEDL